LYLLYLFTNFKIKIFYKYCADRTMLPREQMSQYAETIPDGPTSRRWAGLAKELGVWLLGGSMIEPVEGQPGKLYNTAVLFSDSGNCTRVLSSMGLHVTITP
jgi:predicted amidohydrolase